MGEKLRRSMTRHWSKVVPAARGTVAALAALATAAGLGLENPYWAAMTALIVIQPTRGLLLEKSYYRLVGTVIGAGVGLLLMATRSPLLLTIALVCWLAACVGIGNLLHGLRSYALLMAGCTCAVIAMSSYQNPSHLHAIAFGRVAGIIVGIIVTTGVTVLFTPPGSGDELTDRLRRVAAETVAWLALVLSRRQDDLLTDREQEILIDIAAMESQLDNATDGSLRFRQRKRQIRDVIAALLSLVAAGRMAGGHLQRQDGETSGQWSELLAAQLVVVADRLENGATITCTGEMAIIAAGVQAHLPLLGEILGDIVASLRHILKECGTLTAPTTGEPKQRLIRHRDWQEARRAAVRAALAMGAVGMVWTVTGWSKGPLMLMAMSIMLTIFSAKEHPAYFVGQIFFGAATGSAAAVLCRLVMLPQHPDMLVTIGIIAPLVFLGVLAMQYRKTAIPATDATLFFLFITQPGVPITILPADLAFGAVAMVLGVGTAWLAYRYLIPINPAMRMKGLLTAITRDLEQLATKNAPMTVRARLQHRVIRLVTMATTYDDDHRALVTGGIAALAIATCIQRLREALDDTVISPAAATIITDTLDELGDLSRGTGPAADLLLQAADRLNAMLGAEHDGYAPGHRAVAHTLDHAADLFRDPSLSWMRGGSRCHT
jgi:uncharacterized membrane protein YccC